MDKNLNIIIDTDPGIDDALALGIASVFFKDNIRALISTYGNVDGEQTYSNLINLANLLKIDKNILRLQGSLNPLGKDGFIPTDFHGKNGLCEIMLPNVGNALYNGDFLQDIYNIIKEYKNIKYIAIGPLTNISRLLDKFPDCVDYIDELIIMGGGFDVSNMPNNTEYNFTMDPIALKKVLANPVKKVIAPLDATYQMAFSLEDIEDITGVNRELLSDDMSNVFTVLSTLFYLDYDSGITHNEPGAIIHDSATIAYLLDSSKCDLREYKIISDEYGALSKNPQGYDAFVIDKLDRDFMRELLKETFRIIKSY